MTAAANAAPARAVGPKQSFSLYQLLRCIFPEPDAHSFGGLFGLTACYFETEEMIVCTICAVGGAMPTLR